MVVNRMQIAPIVLMVHDQRGIEQHPRSRLDGGFVSLDIMHDRVHVDNFDGMPIAHDRHKGLEHTISRFDQGNRHFKGLPCFYPFEQNDRVFQPGILADHEIVQQPPAPAVRNPSALLGIRKGDEVEAFWFGNSALERDRSFNCSSMFYINDVVPECHTRADAHYRDKTHSQDVFA